MRRLCKCEERTCGLCDKKAIVVEFQSPMKSMEALLPDASDKKAKFFCKKHCPEDFPFEAPSPRRTESDSVSYEESPEPKQIRKVRGTQHIDPVWAKFCPDQVPTGADSPRQVECVACKHPHRLKDRKLWNGSYSYCPKCGEHMYVPIWEEEKDDGKPAKYPSQGPARVRSSGDHRSSQGKDSGPDDVEGATGEG